MATHSLLVWVGAERERVWNNTMAVNQRGLNCAAAEQHLRELRATALQVHNLPQLLSIRANRWLSTMPTLCFMGHLRALSKSTLRVSMPSRRIADFPVA